MRLLVSTLVLALTLPVLSGCHSTHVQATITNHTAQPLALVELDYPSASFGTQTLAPGASYQYRFKVIGTGDTKLLWTDGVGQQHSVTGPHLTEAADGTLTADVQAQGVHWSASFPTPAH
ncbi:MAG: hypothetical protein KGK08_02685 [Acidobacteriota bacterium]|nr:hypothetical protein [Acidobacteriota bacterium]